MQIYEIGVSVQICRGSGRTSFRRPESLRDCHSQWFRQVLGPQVGRRARPACRPSPWLCSVLSPGCRCPCFPETFLRAHTLRDLTEAMPYLESEAGIRRRSLVGFTFFFKSGHGFHYPLLRPQPLTCPPAFPLSISKAGFGRRGICTLRWSEWYLQCVPGAG